MKFEDCMIDLETLGNTTQTPVVSLGAVFFNIQTKQLGPTFYMVLELEEQLKLGRKPTASTLAWWMKQSDAAKKVFSEQSKPTLQVLDLFCRWFNANNNKAYVWGNGPTFDISIMEDILKMYNIQCPWAFNKIMDVRTYKRFARNGERLIKSGVNHNALDDAISQAKYVMGV